MDRDRVIPLDGIHNFRDYGGYPVAGGRRMKRGLLFRSGQHVEASDADLAAIDRLGLRHVIDFRGASERKSYPCRRGEGFCAQVIAFDGETANLAPHMEAADGVLTSEGAHRAMERIYRNLPAREPVLWVMRQYFAALARGDGASLVHCLAGKDRTGMAVALLHHAVGVHPDDAMEDFLLTNSAGNIEARIAAGGDAIRAKYGAIDDDTIRVLMGVDPRYLHAMREAVEEAHGSLDAFLADVLEVDDARREALRLHLTEG
ncbi:tyrosine-protein phosphatase [Pelagerythrobacter marensis]|uniref:Tyrosine-protein phosphatase n=1 Tax=Pelagerythrobacter marensis TaxID=543877 RepID=A0ABZ2D2C5_9SPHN